MTSMRVRLRFVPGDVIVFTLAPNKRAMQRMAKRRDSRGRAARRILKRLEHWGLGVADVAREIRL